MLSLLLCATSLAGTFEVTLDAAREAILQDDLPLAAGYVRAAELYAPQAPQTIDSEELGRIWLYRGMILYKQNAEDAAQAMDQWRQALAINTELEWDREALDNNNARGLFEALRREVRDYPELDIGVPEKVGAAKLYVDGNRVSAEDEVLEGVHLAQVECPDEQGTFGLWTQFDKPIKWFQLCPDGVDTSVEVADDEPEDDFGEFGPMFGSGDNTAVDNTVYEPLPPAKLEKKKKVNVPLLASAGAAALVGGGMYIAALSSRNQYDDLNNPDVQSIQDLEDLRRQTNTRVYISAGAGVVAIGLYTAAFINF